MNEQYEILYVKVPPDLREQFDNRATEDGENMSSVIRALMRGYVRGEIRYALVGTAKEVKEKQK